MHPASSSSEFDKFLALAKSIISKCQAAGQGELIVKLKRSPNDGSEETFSAFVPCTRSFSFVRPNWEPYRLGQRLPITDEPFDCLIRSVLKVLDDSGHGEIHMDFPRKKGHTLFRYKVIISYQSR